LSALQPETVASRMQGIEDNSAGETLKKIKPEREADI